MSVTESHASLQSRATSVVVKLLLMATRLKRYEHMNVPKYNLNAKIRQLEPVIVF